MKKRDFILEKIYVLFLALVVGILQTLFLIAVGINIASIVFLSILFWLFIISILFIEYYRKAKFYNDVKYVSENLGQKSLLTEVLKEPSFLDGKVLHRILKSLNKNLNDEIGSYEMREREYQEYVNLWVHEIKTPLAASKLIVANNETDVTKRIDEELDKLDGFVEQALYYAKSTSVEKDYIIKEIALEDVVNKVVKKHRNVFLYKEIKVEIQQQGEHVFSDSKWLEFILNQIIDNALKYTKQQGCIQIKTIQNKDSVVLQVTDDGIGIPSQDHSRIFEKGFTGMNGRVYGKATGMGLYLSKSLCDKLYIGIEVVSKEAEGTTISLQIPMNSMTNF